MNPTNTPTPQKPGGSTASEPGPQTSRTAKPEQESKVGNDRGGREESSETEKVRRSNLAGDQDVANADDTRGLP